MLVPRLIRKKGRYISYLPDLIYKGFSILKLITKEEATQLRARCENVAITKTVNHYYVTEEPHVMRCLKQIRGEAK